MKKALGLVLIAAAFIWGSYTPAGAASQYSPVTICHANGDGTYTQKVLLFGTSDDALRVAEHTATTIAYHINDTDADLWPAYNWAGENTSVNVAASHAYVHQVYRQVWVTVNRVRRLVWMWIWEPNPVSVAIYNNGCVAP